MEKLKMIADWCYGEQPASTRNYEDIEIDERDNNSWWYLHGELEHLVQFDKATVTNCKSGGFGMPTIYATEIYNNIVKSIMEDHPIVFKMCFDGIVDVEIEGIDRPCVGYFWTSNHRNVYWNGKTYHKWEQRGLVVFKDDVDANEYAMKKYKEKPFWL